MSPVKILVGDLFESDAQTLTNTVNTVGVMGKGIALQFKKRFPDMYDDYVRRCDAGEVRLGEPYLFRSLLEPWILNFPTKDHWRSLTRLSDITDGLDHLVAHYRAWGITSLAVPPLGCGEGKLEWQVVGRALYRGLARLEIPVELYAPYGTPDDELSEEFLGFRVADTPLRVPPAGVALATIVERIVDQTYHYPIGRVGMQKIAYFATAAGIPTALEYERRPYGPFAPELKPLLSRLLNNGLLSERPTGPMIRVEPGPTLTDGAHAYRDDLAPWSKAIERVVDLFLRLPTTRHAEMAATTHYVAASLARRARARNEPLPGIAEVVEGVLRWKDRHERPPSEDEIAELALALVALGWVELTIPAEENLTLV